LNLIKTWVLAGSDFLFCATMISITLEKQPKSITVNDMPIELKEGLIGLALGDLHMRRRFSNTSLHFKQSSMNHAYILHLYTLFHEYCNFKPRVRDTKLKGKIHQSSYFDTLTYPAFNYYHDLFYKDKTKIVPLNISDLLTVRGLAY
jgi:LAGLIDADG DNA endonuclease family